MMNVLPAVRYINLGQGLRNGQPMPTSSSDNNIPQFMVAIEYSSLMDVSWSCMDRDSKFRLNTLFTLTKSVNILHSATVTLAVIHFRPAQSKEYIESSYKLTSIGANL